MKRTIAIVGAVSSIASVAACSSSGSGGSSAAASPAGSSVRLPTPSAAASGKPIKLFFFNQQGASASASSPESFQAAEAAVDYINKNLGGVKGRPVKLTHCATLGTPDSVTNCANKAVDAKADVVVKGVETAAETAVPILAGAGIPYLTLNAGSTIESTSPDSFVPAAGFAAQLAPPIAYAKEQGYKSIGVVFANVTALASVFEGPIKKLAARVGIKYAAVPVAITTGDTTPAYSALIAKHVDAIYIAGTAAQCASALKARQSLADTHPLFWVSGCNSSSVIDTVPASATNGMLVALPDTSAVTTDPDTKTYHAVMKAYEPSADTGNFAPTSFEAVMDLYRALITAPDPAKLNAKTIASALRSAKNVPLFMGGGKTFTCNHSAFPKSPSICTGAAFLVKYDNGVYKLVRTYDSSKLLKGIS